MRRILVLLLLATVLVAAETAASAPAPMTAFRTPNSQWVELRGGKGRAVLARRGAININVRRGRVRVVDLAGGSRPRGKCGRKRAVRVTKYAVEYRGRRIRCLIWGSGPWQVIMTGRGINASGRVRGSLTLDGVRFGSGEFRIGDGSFRSWPGSPRTFILRR